MKIIGPDISNIGADIKIIGPDISVCSVVFQYDVAPLGNIKSGKIFFFKRYPACSEHFGVLLAVPFDDPFKLFFGGYSQKNSQIIMLP